LGQTLNLSHNPINSAAEIGAPMLALRDLLLGSTGLKDVPLRVRGFFAGFFQEFTEYRSYFSMNFGLVELLAWASS
jgi:hypothetical protein